MKYNVVKNASSINNYGDRLVKNPTSYKGRWKDLFGNNNPICLELGTGRGSFIIEMAKNHPNINYIGLEYDQNQIATAASKASSAKLDNLKLILADARNIVNFFGKEIDTIYLTFSEPWPRKADEKKRFTHESYLRLYDRIFKKHKHIIMKTDNIDLYAYSICSLSEYGYVIKDASLDLHSREEFNVMTEYEKKFSADGIKINYLKAVKK